MHKETHEMTFNIDTNEFKWQCEKNIYVYSTTTTLKYEFSVMPEGIQVVKLLAQEGHANLTPTWSLCTCVQIAAREVDSPSLHSSTWHV